jgi:hypothetical protein
MVEPNIRPSTRRGIAKGLGMTIEQLDVEWRRTPVEVEEEKPGRIILPEDLSQKVREYSTLDGVDDPIAWLTKAVEFVRPRGTVPAPRRAEPGKRVEALQAE